MDAQALAIQARIDSGRQRAREAWTPRLCMEEVAQSESCLSAIAPGAIWVHRDGPAVVLVGPTPDAARVAFSDGFRTCTFHMPVAEFRESFAPIYDRTEIYQWFSMTLANLDEFRAYWIPGRQSPIARGLSARKNWPVPPGAIFVGQYVPPCNPRTFLEDLDGVLSSIHAKALSGVSGA